jgi:hypothetical protein
VSLRPRQDTAAAPGHVEHQARSVPFEIFERHALLIIVTVARKAEVGEPYSSAS